MAGERNFDKLVSELTLNERQGLLEKMKSQSTLPRGPLYFEDDKLVPAYDLEDEYSSLPWYYRLWYFILSFFKSKAPVKLFEEKSVSVLGIMVDQRSPGLYDYQKVMLLPGFYRQVLRLKEAAQFFYSALDSSVNRDKGGFFAFLGSRKCRMFIAGSKTEHHPPLLQTSFLTCRSRKSVKWLLEIWRMPSP